MRKGKSVLTCHLCLFDGGLTKLPSRILKAKYFTPFTEQTALDLTNNLLQPNLQRQSQTDRVAYSQAATLIDLAEHLVRYLCFQVVVSKIKYVVLMRVQQDLLLPMIFDARCYKLLLSRRKLKRTEKEQHMVCQMKENLKTKQNRPNLTRKRIFAGPAKTGLQKLYSKIIKMGFQFQKSFKKRAIESLLGLKRSLVLESEQNGASGHIPQRVSEPKQSNPEDTSSLISFSRECRNAVRGYGGERVRTSQGDLELILQTTKKHAVWKARPSLSQRLNRGKPVLQSEWNDLKSCLCPSQLGSKVKNKQKKEKQPERVQPERVQTEYQPMSRFKPGLSPQRRSTKALNSKSKKREILFQKH